MARIIYGAIVESIRGSIGGTTFQRNAYGYTVKKKPNIINPNSPLQNAQKLIMSQVTRSWRDLTQSKRDQYNSWASSYPQYAKNNPDSQLSGYAVFVKYNCLRLLSGGAIYEGTLNAPPATDTLLYQVGYKTTLLQIYLDSLNDDDAWMILFFLSNVWSSSRNFVGTLTRYLNVGSNQSGFYSIDYQYENMYGYLPSIGQYVAMSTVLIGANSPIALARETAIYEVENLEP